VILWSVVSLIALVGVLLNPGLPDVALLGPVLALCIGVALRMGRAFSSMPSGFPDDAWAGAAPGGRAVAP
jgi:hypothetical protein